MIVQAIVRRLQSRLERLRRQRRAASWQKVSASGGYVRHAVRPGLFLDLPAESELSRFVYVDNLEGIERRLLSSLLRPGDLFVDVGANFGLYAIDAATLVGPSGAVLAFEPASSAFDHLRHNIDRAGLTNIDARQIAISDSDGQAVMKVSRGGRDAWNTLGASLHESAHELQPVKTTTLDAIVAGQQTSRQPAMVKVDVEGWEDHVVRGAATLLGGADAPLVQMEFAPDYCLANGVDIASLRDALIGHGYELFHPVSVESMRVHRPGTDELSGNLYAAKRTSQWFSRLQPLLDRGLASHP